MNLTEEQVRAILACSGFELVEFAVVEDCGAWGALVHPEQCTCDACQRQRGEKKQ